MAKKKNKKPKQAEIKAPASEEKLLSEQPIPKFEIGVKGDEFDKAYTRAAKAVTADTDKLLYDLSRESRADKFNLLDTLIPFIIIVFTALALISLSRGELDGYFTVKLSPKALADGSYTKMLDDIYADTLPYGEEIRFAASLFGFGDGQMPVYPDEELDEPDLPDEPDIDVPVVTEPPVTESTVTTTTEVTTEATTTTPEATQPQVMLAYANAAVNIRSLPSADGDRLGGLRKGEEIQVTAILDNGWYEVIYEGQIAYAYGEYLTFADNTDIPEVTFPTENEEEETTVSLDERVQIMYAIDVATIRLTPDNGGVNVGYFVAGDPVYVLHIGSDGWAEVQFGSTVAYVRSELLANEPIATAVETEEEEPLPEITEETEAVTEAPQEETEESSQPEEETEEVTQVTEESQEGETTTSIDWNSLFPGIF